MRTLTEEGLASFYALTDLMPATAGTADPHDQSGSRLVTNLPAFPEGEVEHPEYGTLSFDPKTLRNYVRNFDSRVRKIDICVDVDHKNEEAAGWVKRLKYAPGDGVYADVEFNRKGQELLADKRYRYISPQFGDYTDEQSGETYHNVLIALTLTNFPFLKAMPAISLNERRARRAQRASYSLNDFRLTLPEFVRPTQGRRAPFSPSMKKTKDKRCRSGCAMCALGGRKELIS